MLPVFKHRSSEKELLDGDDIPAHLLHRNLEELDKINRFLGGHRVTLGGLASLMKDKTREYTITDIGCGGGDTLKAVARWAEAKGFRVRLTGVDINEDALAFAQDACREHPGIRFIASDYREYINSAPRADIVICSLFCHHLDDTELMSLFAWMDTGSTLGFVINDLHRHPVAWGSIWLISRVFGGSVMLRNDAPLSVVRGFRKHELEALLARSLPGKSEISWQWAFRYRVIYRK